MCFQKKLREVEEGMRSQDQSPNPVAAHARTMLCCISNQRAGKCPYMNEDGEFDATRAALRVCPVSCPLSVDGRGDPWQAAASSARKASPAVADSAPAAEPAWPWSGVEEDLSVG